MNATPDSFSDGGRYERAEDAVRHGLALAAEGAAVVDVGGESTRPGARPVPPEEEARRVVPVVRSLVAAGIAVPVSVDTRNAEVAAAALDAGASIVNDISAGTHDPAMLPLVARRGAGIVLMHMRGTPETMARETAYGDVVSEVLAWLLDRAAVAEAEGIPRGRIRIDPGIGFGKDLEGNLALLRSLERFVATGRPVLVGASRKSFLGALTGRATGDRLAGSLAAVARAREAGVAAVRVHDVAATCDLLRVLAAVGPSGPRPPGV